MNLVLFSVLGLVTWSILLGLSIVSYRGVLWMLGKNKVTDFTPGIEHGSALYWRLNRAQVNAAENLALFGVVIFIVYQFGQVNELIGQLCLVYLVARVCQSLVHIAGNNTSIIVARATFLVAQYACLAVILLQAL